MTELIDIGGMPCRIHTSGTGGPVIFWGSHGVFGDRFEAAVGLMPDTPYVLVEFEVGDWNADYSPWHANMGDTEFGGNGRSTLGWLLGSAVPYVRDNFPDSSYYIIAGYSLAGLFALWSFYSSDAFRGCACCSGSLWFDGWDAFADSAALPEGGKVYLSLGGKEPGSGNEFTRTIGDCYTRQRLRLKKRNTAVKYETNPGGHFSDPAKRMAKAFAWFLQDN